MGDLFFVFKSLIMTIVLVLLLQIKIGDATLEDHTMGWLRQSWFAGKVQGVGGKGISVLQNATQKVSGTWGKWFGSPDKKPVDRKKLLIPARSQAFLEEQSRKAKEAVEKATEQAEEVVGQ